MSISLKSGIELNLNSGVVFSDRDISKNKIIILVTGTTNKPYDKNWKECERTWIPELRKMGYDVKVAIGNPKLKDYYSIKDNIIYFRADDSKFGLYDKSIKMPIIWILAETNYQYYIRIDSDSFVEPKRFDEMIRQNLTEVRGLDYMGCCHPNHGWNPHHRYRLFLCKNEHIASGCAYMVSRKAMVTALGHMRITNPDDLKIDDWVLGRAMWENKIPLLHDNRIIFESKYKQLTDDPFGVGMPDISEPNSHLAIQHYMNGHMEEAMVRLGYRNK
jgi:hypothetical protein